MGFLEDELGVDGVAPGASDVDDAYDARFFLSALLIYVARGDGNISGMESNKMIELLTSHLDIRSAEAMESLSGAVNKLSDEKDIAQTLRRTAERMTADQKHGALRMMFEVAGVDDVQDVGEVEAINLAARIMGLPQGAVNEAWRVYSGEA